MSYSIGVRAPSRTAALAELAEKFDRDVVALQPIHAKDRAQALQTAEVFLGLVDDYDATAFDVQISLSGSLGWQGLDDERKITASNVSVSVYLMPKG